MTFANVEFIHALRAIQNDRYINLLKRSTETQCNPEKGDRQRRLHEADSLRLTDLALSRLSLVELLRVAGMARSPPTRAGCIHASTTSAQLYAV